MYQLGALHGFQVHIEGPATLGVCGGRGEGSEKPKGPVRIFLAWGSAPREGQPRLPELGENPGVQAPSLGPQSPLISSPPPVPHQDSEQHPQPQCELVDGPLAVQIWVPVDHGV